MLVRMGGGVGMIRRGRQSQATPSQSPSPTPTPTPTPTPSPTPSPSLMNIPAYWGWYGDSHTGGRETEVTAANPKACFRLMWEASFTPPSVVDTSPQNGVSGRSLANTLIRCLSRTFAGTPWIHMQESGDQNLDGQRTPTEWGNTFQQGWIDVEARWPGCFKSYETPHSFSPARKAENWRNWDNHNIELRARITALAGLGITVHLVETEYYIDLAIAEFGYDNVCFPDTDPNAYHFQGLGNFVISLAQFKKYGYDVTALNHSGINLNSAQKATAVAIVAGN